jgi:hypothetical protein
MSGIFKAAAVISVLLKVCTIFVMTGHINVMLVLQSCTDPLQVMAGSSTVTFPTSSDGTNDVGNIKVEEDLDIKEEEEVNVKTENVTVNDEEECIDIKVEEDIYSEEEEDEVDVEKIEEEIDIETIE